MVLMKSVIVLVRSTFSQRVNICDLVKYITFSLPTAAKQRNMLTYKVNWKNNSKKTLLTVKKSGKLSLDVSLRKFVLISFTTT